MVAKTAFEYFWIKFCDAVWVYFLFILPNIKFICPLSCFNSSCQRYTTSPPPGMPELTDAPAPGRKQQPSSAWPFKSVKNRINSACVILAAIQ
jgi:hypothetical protein